MRRIVSLWLPRFSIERLLREKKSPAAPGQPLVLVLPGAKGLRLAACDETALAFGLQPGEKLADARAKMPHLASALAEPEKDSALLLRLAHWAEQWSPWIALDPPDGLFLDVTGIPHLFGGEERILADMGEKFARLRLTVRLAMAGTSAAAWALARFGALALPPTPALPHKGGGRAKARPRHPLEGGRAKARLQHPSPLGGGVGGGAFPIVSQGGERMALEALPVEALRLDPETVRTLRRLGLKRVGSLYGIPRPSLARRFGSAKCADDVLRRLDEALGLSETPLSPLKPQPDFVVRRSVLEPLATPEGVSILLDRLAEDMASLLERAGQGALRLVLTLYRLDGSRAVVPAGLAAPSRDAPHIACLLAPKLERIDLGFGVEAATLAAVPTAPDDGVEPRFLGGKTGKPLAELADRVANRFDRTSLQGLAAAESHVPERAEVCMAPCRLGSPPSPSLPRKGGEGRLPSSPSPLAGEGRGGGQAIDVEATRPLLLLDRPEAVAVIAEVPDGPPRRFTWRRVSRLVLRAEGPERIAPEWWRGDVLAHVRDYYVVEDEAGRRYWLYRLGLYGELPPSWFLHGFFP